MVLIPDWLDAAARNRGTSPAMTFGGQSWTHEELRSRAAAATQLLSRHVERPSRVAVLSANRPGFVVAIHAARRAGLEVVPLNWRLASDELARQVSAADVALILADQERMTVASSLTSDRPTSTLSIELLEEGALLRENRTSLCEIDLDAGAVVMFTSGTSGRPKGARLTLSNLWHSAAASLLHLGHQSSDSWLAALPLFHVGGFSIVMRSCISQVPFELHDRFDPERVLRAIGSGPTLVSLVPTMLERLLEAAGKAPWPRTLRCVLLGGSATPRSLVAESLKRTIPIAPTYGLTESASQVTTLLPDQVAARPESSGLPLPGTQVRIGKAELEPAEHATGQIEVRGPTLFSGYLNGTGDRDNWMPDGWFRTGDLGYLDQDGFLYVVDRRDDLIISGGENIYPAEIERALREHPSVGDAGVYGIADERWGQRPIAWVVWRGDPREAEQTLRAHCQSQLAPYKTPEAFQLVPELPRSPSGKLLRRELPGLKSAQESDAD